RAVIVGKRALAGFAARRVGCFLFEAELVAAMTAQHKPFRVRRRKLCRETTGHLVDLEIPVAGPQFVTFGNLCETGMSTLGTFELSRVAIACGHGASSAVVRSVHSTNRDHVR